MLPGQLVLRDHAAKLVDVRAFDSVVIHFHQSSDPGHIVIWGNSFMQILYVAVVRLLVTFCNPSEEINSI